MKCPECEELRKELAALREVISNLRLQPQRVDHYHHTVTPYCPAPVYSGTTPYIPPPWTVSCGRIGV